MYPIVCTYYQFCKFFDKYFFAQQGGTSFDILMINTDMLMDARDMTFFPDESFDCVIDKGNERCFLFYCYCCRYI